MEFLIQMIQLLPPEVITFLTGNLVLIMVGVAYTVVEYVLGKTDLVKANSTLELVLTFVQKGLGGFKRVLEILKASHVNDKVLK